MIAVIKVGGHQALVKKGDVIEIDKIDVEAGKNTTFPVLMLSGEEGENFKIGTPAIEGTEVQAKVVEQGKGDKIRVYKMKPRKRYRRNLGFRALYTVIEITDIPGDTGTTKKAAAPSTDAKVKDDKKKAAPAKKADSKKDDLTKIEGVGPKIAETLSAAGLSTFADLAKAKAEDIQEIIKEVRGNHEATTWPQQAQLAADGKWDELKTLQDELNGGKAE